MNSTLPLTRDLVLIGGGHTHTLALRKWGMRPLPGARLTLIDPSPKAPYTGMLPGHVAGHYQRSALDIDLARLARFAGARLIIGHAIGIDRAARRVHVEGRPDIAYDVLSIDIGISSAPLQTPGFAQCGIAAKPLGPFADHWLSFINAVRRGTTPPACTVLGGGIGGVELALAMQYRLSQITAATQLHVIDTGRALTDLAPATRRRLRAELRKAGIGLIEASAITRISADTVELANGTRIASAFTVAAAGAQPWPWLAETGLELEDGFISVGPDLRSTNDPAIFAAGDCAHLSHAPRPKAGVFAVRAAPILHANLRAALGSPTRTRHFKPQKHYLKLISLGRKSAIAERASLGLHLPGFWYWKNRIDQRFMQKFRALPAMPAPLLPRKTAEGVTEELSAHPMLCGGCGAKVGPAALEVALARARAAQPGAKRSDVLIRPGDDAAALAIGGQVQVISTDHLRGFIADPWLMARITAIHALGDVWAMGATPQAALVNLVLPRMSGPLQARTLAEIMAAAQDVMAESGAEIIGGHTTQGAELTIGFTVTGLVPEGRAPIGINGARPGDQLILTGALGTGVILAADMAAQADGTLLHAALSEMATSPRRAAQPLRAAHAMTDVTGFGLAGHLLAICRASGCGATLDMAALPLLEGAQSLLETGRRSSLHAANKAHSLPDITGFDNAARSEILFDPQTAGGFLAALAPDTAKATLAELHRLGIAATLIGALQDGPPRITLR